tara:strand:- start:340 stop:492 length:153 start_codon:yes stop_codon:yes gene_type:complete
MKVCLVLKSDKFGVKEVISFTRKFTERLDIFSGEFGNPFPKKLLNSKYDI